MGPGPRRRRPAFPARGAALAGALFLLLVSMTVFSACGGKGDDAATSKATVVLLREEVPGAALLATATSRLPPFVIKPLPEGRGSRSYRMSAVLDELVADPGLRAIVIVPAGEGTASAVAKVRGARKDLVWILAESGDEALAAEAVADLVVNVAGREEEASPIDPALDPALARGLCELARRVATGKARVDDRNEILAALRAVGGWRWKAEYRTDPASGLKARNHVLVSAQLVK